MDDRHLGAQAEQLWAVVKDLCKFLQFRDRDAITMCGLSVAQCYTLEAMGTQGQVMLNTLADALYISPSTASRTVDELVRQGLVERRPDATDRRAICLTLTPQGQMLYEALHHHFIQRHLAILQQIAPESRRSVLTALQQLTQAVKDPSCCAISFEWDGQPLPLAGLPAGDTVLAPSQSQNRPRHQRSTTSQRITP